MNKQQMLRNLRLIDQTLEYLREQVARMQEAVQDLSDGAEPFHVLRRPGTLANFERFHSEVGTRAYNCLSFATKEKILGDVNLLDPEVLKVISDAHLLRIPNLGRHTLREIREALK